MKRLTAMFLTLLLLLSLSACGTASQNQTDNTDSGNSQTEEPTVTDDGTETESGFPFTLTTKDGAEVTFTHVPERVIAANANAGDQLMALGLGDKIIATAYTNSDINPQWDAEYKAIPSVAETYISLETILDLEPDFVYGRSSSFTEKYNTEHDTLSQYGIMSLSSIEGYTVGADVDVVYEDFYNLGRIFQVEDKAEEIVSAIFGMWLTPIMWEPQMIPARFQWLIKLNPMYYIVEGYRDCLLEHQWFWQFPKQTAYFWLLTLGFFFLGITVFRRLRPHFADVL